MRGNKNLALGAFFVFLAVSMGEAQSRTKAGGSGSRSGQSGVAGTALRAPVRVQLNLPALNSSSGVLLQVPGVKPSVSPSELPALPLPLAPVESVILAPEGERPEVLLPSSEQGGEAEAIGSRELFEGKAADGAKSAAAGEPSLWGRLTSIFSRPDIVPEWPGKTGSVVRLAGKTYVLEKRIGAGEGAAVYKSGENTVVKLIYPGLANDPLVGGEASSLEALAHTDIPHARLLARSSDGLVLVKQFVAGETMSELLKKGPLRRSQRLALADLGAFLVRIGYGGDLNPGNLVWDHWRGHWALIDGGGFGFAKPSSVFSQLSSEVLREHGGVEEVELLASLRGRLGPSSQAWARLIQDSSGDQRLKEGLDLLEREDERRAPAPRIVFGGVVADRVLTNEAVSPSELSRRLGFDPKDAGGKIRLKRDRIKTNTEVWKIKGKDRPLVIKESGADIIRREIAVRAVIARYFGRLLDTPNSLGTLRGSASFMVMEMDAGNFSYYAEMSLERRVALGILARTFGLSDVNRENVLFGPEDRVSLIDFEQSLYETSAVSNRIPDQSILDELPWVSAQSPNAIEDYFPAIAAWRELFSKPQTQKELEHLFLKSGFSSLEVGPLLRVLKGNVDRLEWVLQTDVDFANSFQGKR